MKISPKHIIHIHNDKKFISLVEDYEHPHIHNEFIFIGDLISDFNEYAFTTFSSTRKGVRNIIEKCGSADLVVIYNLDFVKAYIVNRIPENVKILWRFFGVELYKNIPEKMLSTKTRNVLPHQNMKVGQRILIKLSWIKFFSRWKTRARNEIQRARLRCNYIMTTTKLEYELLQKTWSNLPIFIQAPFTILMPNNLIPELNKKHQIIIGHSRSQYNNHLDIIEMIKDSNIGNVSFILFFSYGQENSYTEHVRQMVTDYPQFILQEKYLSKDQFNIIYHDSSALVINAYRQLAGNNIMTAFKNGVKVYLNKKNVLYHFFKEKGFLVYDVDSLVHDIKSDEYSLNEEEMHRNIMKVKELALEYSRSDFQQKLMEEILDNK